MNKKIILLALSALAMRILFYQLYSPLFTMDSQTCVETAKALFGDGLNYYTGKRTLVYPLVIALFGYDTQALVLFQMFLGILESLLVYAIFYKLSRNEWMGFAAGMLYALNPSQIFLERAILAETVLTLFIAFTFLCFFKALEKTEKHLWGILSQIACSIAVLTKPQVIFFPPLLGLLLAYHYFRNVDRRITKALVKFFVTVLPAVIILGSWSYFNYRSTEHFAVSTAAGDALILHTHPFIELAPDKYDELKEIYIKHREIKYRRTGIYSPMTLLPAKIEAMEKLGMNYAQLSALLKEVSIYLILHNPGKYLKSVLFSFKRFWYPTWYTGKGGISRSIKSGELARAIPAALFAIPLAYSTLLFFLFPVALLFSIRVRKNFQFDFRIFSIYLVILFAGIFQAFVINSTETARYKMPFEPFIFGFAVIYSIGLWNFFKGFWRKR